MKKLLFIITLVIFSCEKEPEIPITQRTCWECKQNFTGQIPQQVRYFCDKTDIGLSVKGEITADEIRVYELNHTITGVVTTKCTKWKETK